MPRDIKISNFPLPRYMEFNDYIILKSTTCDLKTLMYISLFALSIKDLFDIKFGIACHEHKKQWIPNDIKWFDFGRLHKFSYTIDLDNPENLHKLLKTFDLKNLSLVFSKQPCSNNILLCLNGNHQASFRPEIEMDVYYYINNKYDCSILVNPENYQKNYPSGTKLIHIADYNSLYNTLLQSKVVISTDNVVSMMSNRFENTKTIGIFGPTTPIPHFKFNNINIIQLIDEKIAQKNVKKSCPCQNPKFCHHSGYYNYNKYPYCFNSLSSEILIKKIAPFLNI